MRRMMMLVVAGMMAGCSAAAMDGGSLGAASDAPRAVQHQSQALQSAEAMVPYSDVLTYPGDWVELSRRRSGN